MAISALSKSSIGTFDRFQKTSAGNTAVANALFVLGGGYSQTNNLATSTDGVTWTLRTMTSMGNTYGYLKLGSYYINVTAYGTLRAVTDPIAGTPFDLGQFGIITTSNTWQGADYINNRWVWWGDYGIGFDSFVSNSFSNMKAAAYGNGKWVLSRNGGVQYATAAPTAPFPLTGWTSASFPVSSPEKLIYANGLFVCTGSDGIATSPDGVTWTTRSSAGSFSGGRIVYTGGLFFAAINGGNLYTSTDGVTWSSRGVNFSGSQFLGAAYGNGTYVIVSNSGQLWTSTDGVNYTSRTGPMSGYNWYTGTTVNGPSIVVYG